MSGLAEFSVNLPGLGNPWVVGIIAVGVVTTFVVFAYGVVRYLRQDDDAPSRPFGWDPASEQSPPPPDGGSSSPDDLPPSPPPYRGPDDAPR